MIMRFALFVSTPETALTFKSPNESPVLVDLGNLSMRPAKGGRHVVMRMPLRRQKNEALLKQIDPTTFSPRLRGFEQCEGHSARLAQVSYSDQQDNKLVISDKYFEQQFTEVHDTYYQETRVLNQEDFDPYKELIRTDMAGKCFRPTELF